MVNGSKLTPVEVQAPLVQSETPFDDKTPYSLRFETDLVPFKPASDIVLHAIARSPGRKPAPCWRVCVEVGRLRHTVTALGPNVWERTMLGGWKRRKYIPTTEVPLRYEHAFGGKYQTPPRRGESVPRFHIYGPNPVGKGWVDRNHPPQARAIEGAQLQDPRLPIEDPRSTYLPQGLNPMHRSWSTRRKHAGTFDEAWQETRAPEWPVDYDETFHQSAHPQLRYPGYLQGGEPVTLSGLMHDATPLTFTLPRYRVFALVRYRSGAMEIRPAALDTVYFDVASSERTEHRVYLTWRATFADSEKTPVRKVEARMDLEPHTGTHG